MNDALNPFRPASRRALYAGKRGMIMMDETQISIFDVLDLIENERGGGETSAEQSAEPASDAITYAIQASSRVPGTSASHRVFGTVSDCFDASFDVESFQPDPDWLLSRFPMLTYYLTDNLIASDDTIDIFFHRLDASGSYVRTEPDARVTVSASRLVDRWNTQHNA